MTSCHGPVFIRTIFLNQHCTYREAVSLTRLVKAEIVSPLLRDSHQYGRGQPSRARWYDFSILGKFQTATRRTLDIHPLYKGAKACPFLFALNRILPPP